MTKVPIFAIIFIILSTLIVVLWQRQPKLNQDPKEESTQEAQTGSEETLGILPKDGTVVANSPIKIQGKVNAKSIIAIYKNGQQTVTTATDAGDFEKDVDLGNGLNLIKIVTISPDLTQTDEKTISLFLSKSNVGNTLFAGPVKSIFDTLITVTTFGGDKNIRTSKSTNFEIPTDEDEKEATQEVDNVRIGDYVIATGDASDSDSIVAQGLEIIRANKPQVTKQLAIGTVASTVRQNIFSLKSAKDQELIEFTLDKNSDVSLDGKEAKSTDIVKDKTALVFYTKDEDENLITLIYLLP